MPAHQKKLLRIAMKNKRSLLYTSHPKAGQQLATLFFEHFNFPLSTVVGAYWPIGSELDLRPLLSQLVEKGYHCALPCITSHGLVFREWTKETVLVNGTFQTLEPSPDMSLLVPHVLLIPLLAFDKRGHRLGYGQGHFDKYLHHHPTLTIGVGFRGQEIEEIPRQPHDFALDSILTEEGLLCCHKESL